MHGHHGTDSSGAESPSNFRLALSATLHCLLGCGLGEIVGMFLSMALHLAMVPAIVVTITLGFVFGFVLGMIPLIRAGFTFGRAFKQVLIAESLSIAVMEGVEVAVALQIPGVRGAHATDPMLWIAMLIGLAAGFIAAFPVNFLFVARGIRHQH